MRGVSIHKKKQLCFYFYQVPPGLSVQCGKQEDQMAAVNPLISVWMQLRPE